VQAAHAAIEATRQFPSEQPEHPHLVVCGMNSEQRLLSAADHLFRSNIRFTLFREPDRHNQVTALATEPVTGNRRRLLDRYRCLNSSDFLAARDLRGITVNPGRAAEVRSPISD